jgi:hypothetical protein
MRGLPALEQRTDTAGTERLRSRSVLSSHHHVALVVIAYIDPGSGFVMIQVLGGAALGAWFYFRQALRRTVDRMVGRPVPVPITVNADDLSSTKQRSL